jgi:hypothetical protein
MRAHGAHAHDDGVESHCSAKKIAAWITSVDGGNETSMAAAIRDGAVDVQRLAATSGLGGKSTGFAGLRDVCAHFCAQQMSKDEQTSDWAARPLRAEQLAYAALDASANLRVLDAIESDWGEAALPTLDRRLLARRSSCECP